MSSLKLPNIGIALRCLGKPSSLVDTARHAERAGFDSVWLVEVSDVDTMALASSVSQVTKRIRVATGVVNSYLRLPTLLAMGAATLSDLSNGRFTLGIGAGHSPMSFSSRVLNDRPLIRLKETLQILRLCLSGGKVDFHGKLFDVDGFKLGLRPFRKVPVFGAAMGLKTLEIVLEFADGALLMMPTLEYMKDVNRTISKRRRRLSRRRSFPVACHFRTAVSTSRLQAERMAKTTVLNYVSVPAYRNSFARMGFSDEVRELEHALSNRQDRTAWEKVPTDMAESLVVYGTAEECVEKLLKFVKEGVTHPIVYPCMAPSEFPDMIDKTIHAFVPYLSKSKR